MLHINVQQQCEALAKEKFVAPSKLLPLLPNFESAQKNLDELFDHIVNGIYAATCTNRQSDLLNYMSMLEKYLIACEFRIKKDRLIELIKFFADLLLSCECLIPVVAVTLRKLIVKSKLTRKDIQLDWKPIHEMAIKVMRGKAEGCTFDDLKPLVKLNRFYALEEIPQMWAKITEHFCPTISISRFHCLTKLFIGFEETSAEELQKYSIPVWFPTMWQMYNVDENNWLNYKIFLILSEMVENVPHALNWTPYYDTIFTKLTRMMCLSAREGKVAIGDRDGKNYMEPFAKFISGTIGGPNSCIAHLERLMKMLESYSHPANEGDHSSNISVIISTLSGLIVERLYCERVKKHKPNYPKEYYITEEELTRIVKCLLNPVLFQLYLSVQISEYVTANTFRCLAMMDIGQAVPKFLDHAYSAIFAVDEPMRLESTMLLIVNIIYVLASDKDVNKPHPPCETDWVEKLEIDNGNRKKIIKRPKSGTVTYRHHLFYILELFISAIDVNDYSKSNLALQLITMLVGSIPIAASDQIDPKVMTTMSEDDRYLCQLTGRFPELVMKLLEKALALITCLSVCTNDGKLDDFTTKDGEEEQSFSSSIHLCLMLVFKQSHPSIIQRIVTRVEDFAKHNQFDSYIATSLLSTIIDNLCLASEAAWKKFSAFLLKKLEEVLTEDMQHMEKPPQTVLYYVILSTSIFSVPNHQIVLDNEALFVKILKPLLACKSRACYSVGIQGLDQLLNSLVKTRGEMDAAVQNELFKADPKKWNPLTNWAKTKTREELAEMVWHVPDKQQLDVATRMVHTLVLPAMKNLRETTDKIILRRDASLVNCIVGRLHGYIPIPKSPKLPKTAMFREFPNTSEPFKPMVQIDYEIKMPDQTNFLEYLVATMEIAIEKPTIKEEPTVMSTFSSLLNEFIRPGREMETDLASSRSYHKSVFSYFIDKFENTKKCQVATWYSLAESHYHLINIYLTPYSTERTEFVKKCIQLIIKIQLHDYDKVKVSALPTLSSLSLTQPEFFDYVIDDILAPLVKKSKNLEEVKGSLQFLTYCSEWASNYRPQVVEKIVKAILTMELYDRADILELVNSIQGSIQEWPTAKEIVFQISAKSKQHAKKLFAKAKKSPIWKEIYDNVDRIESEYKQWRETKKGMKRNIEKMLVEMVNKKTLFHQRAKIAKTMAYLIMRNEISAASMKMCVEQLMSEEGDQRQEAIERIALCLKQNKPKTIRVNYKCPQTSEEDLKNLKCGLTMQKMMFVYDSQNLPDTAEKWNNMIFFSTRIGAYRMPEKVSVVRKRSEGEPLNVKPLNDVDKEVLKFFESSETVHNWIELLSSEMDVRTPDFRLFMLIKYVIRNYPQAEKVVSNLGTELDTLMKKKDRDAQRLAADIFLGIAMGLKHRPFEQLDKFWRWATVAVEDLFKIVYSTSIAAWSAAIIQILEAGTDHRRNWWLIESQLNALNALSENMDGWKQTCRMDAIQCDQWRYSETRKRLLKIELKMLQKPSLETSRETVYYGLMYTNTINQSNWNNNLEDVPDRFRLDSLDHYVKMLKSKITATKSERKPLLQRSAASRSDTCLPSPRQLPPTTTRQRRLSEKDRQNVNLVTNYQRTLIEYLMLCITSSYMSYTPAIIDVLPMLLSLANEEEYVYDENLVKDVDLKQRASQLVNEVMSCMWLSPEYVDRVLDKLIETYNLNMHERSIRIAVIKFVHVAVVSNLYIMTKEHQRKKVEMLMMKAISDRTICIRKEASKCLAALFLCDALSCHPETVATMAKNVNSKKLEEWKRHGACLYLSAVLAAYPFDDIPPFVPKAIAALCMVTAGEGMLHRSASEAIREFRLAHREHWPLVCKKLGAELAYDIENATAPAYYA